ncbi:MAG: ATP phosphoribosyltransferase _ HisGs, partial [uncultured Solirubrobacteraceae bacterium]
ERRPAHHRGAPRRAAARDARPPRRAGDRHERGPRQRPQAALRGRRDRHDAAVRRADLRRGGRRRHRLHRQGRAHGAVRARRLRAARPGLRPLPDGDGDGGRRGPGAGGAAAPRRHAHRDEVPEDRRAALRAHGPPGGDRRGQGLRRARAAHRPGGGDRRPHRDGHDPARERARGARGDLRRDRAADRQPGVPQAQGAGDRRRGAAAPCRL